MIKEQKILDGAAVASAAAAGFYDIEDLAGEIEDRSEQFYPVFRDC